MISDRVKMLRRGALASPSKLDAIDRAINQAGHLSVSQGMWNGKTLVSQTPFGTFINQTPGYENPIPLGPHVLAPVFVLDGSTIVTNDGSNGVYFVKPIYCATDSDDPYAPFVRGVPVGTTIGGAGEVVPATCVEEVFVGLIEIPPAAPVEGLPYQGALAECVLNAIDPVIQVEVYGVYDNTVIDGTMDVRMRRYFHWPFSPVMTGIATADAEPNLTGVPIPNKPTGWWTLPITINTSNPQTVSMTLPGGVRRYSGEWEYDDTPPVKLSTTIDAYPSFNYYSPWHPISLPYGLDPSPIGTIKGWNFDITNDGETPGKPQIPLGWSPIELDGSGGRFLVSLSPTAPYDTLGKTDGYAWHGTGQGAANNHPDHAEHHHTLTISQGLTGLIDHAEDIDTDGALLDDIATSIELSDLVVEDVTFGVGGHDTGMATANISVVDFESIAPPNTSSETVLGTVGSNTTGIINNGHDHLAGRFGLAVVEEKNGTNVAVYPTGNGGGWAGTSTVADTIVDSGHSHSLSAGTGHSHTYDFDHGHLVTDGSHYHAGLNYDHGHEVIDGSDGLGHEHLINAFHAHSFNIDGLAVAVSLEGAQDTSDAVVEEGTSAVEHTGPFNSDKDTDNAPPYQVIGAWIVRTDYPVWTPA